MEIEFVGGRNRELASPRMEGGRREGRRMKRGQAGGFISIDNGQVILRILRYVCISYNGGRGGLAVLF